MNTDVSSLVDLVARPGTIVLGLAIYILTFLIRRAVETQYPHLRKLRDANAPGVTYTTVGARWWNEVLLYLIPVVLGGAAALVVPLEEVFLFGDIPSKAARVPFGCGVAWFASTIYKIIKKTLKQRSGGAGTGDSVPPSA